MRARWIGWVLAAAMVVATLPLGAGIASAGGGVTETPNIAQVPTGKVLWTNTSPTKPMMQLSVNVPSGVAEPTVTYGGAPVGAMGGSPGAGGSTAYLYGVQPLPNVAPQSLSVAYSVYGTSYTDAALLGLDNSLLEMGAPSATTVNLTLFAHSGGTVNTSSIVVNYCPGGTACAAVSVTPTANANGSASLSFQPSGGVSSTDTIQITYADTSGNQYDVGGSPSVATQWLTGSVTNSAGSPLGGVQLQAFSPGSTNFGQTFTGGDGGFTLAVPATGTYELTVNPQGLPYVQQQTSVTVAAGANAVAAIRMAAPAATVTGVVYDGTTNQPLANAFVNMFQMTTAPTGSASGTGTTAPPAGGQAVTAADGSFTVALPQTGQYALNVQPPFTGNPHNLVAYTATETVGSGTVNLNVVLQPANATVTGTVTALGSPVANAPVSFVNVAGAGFAFGQTNSSGQYSIPIGQGTWMVQLNGQTAAGQPLQALNMAQTVSPSADLSSGQLVIGAGTGQTVTDNIALSSYDVPLDVAVTVGGSTPAQAFAFAIQGTGAGAPGGPAGPGVFATPQLNSDGSPGDYSSTGRLHLHLSAGTWQVGVGVGAPTGTPTIRQFTVTISGSGSSATIQAQGRGVSLTSGSPTLATVAMAAQNQVITVTVTGGPNNQPVSGAMVGAFNDNGNFVPGDGSPPETNSSGQDTIHVSKGHWNVVVMEPGYGLSAPVEVDTTAGTGSYTATVNLGAQLPYTISGSVTANGNAVPGAAVIATQDGETPVSTTTGPTGAYSLNVGAGVWNLTVHARQYDTAGIAAVASPAMSAGTSSATVNLNISTATARNVVLSGTLYEPGGTTPLANATVSAVLSGSPGQPPVTAVTASDGTWQMPVTAGTWSVSAVAPGYLPSAAQSEAATSGTVSGISLTVGAALPDTLSGTVTDSTGSPIANAIVTAGDPSTQSIFQALTGADGTYTIAVSDGAYTMHVHAPGYTDAVSSSTVSVSGGGTATENFQLASGEAVTGTVTVGGTATGGIEVDAANAADSSQIVTATTNAAGQYTLNLTAGTWSLTAYSSGVQLVSSPLSVTVANTSVSGQNLSIQ